mmetsp:Transcript_11932/g.30165  ORF Transcript_11932/g.30165 Transcript_11932/m.30165 type:complete len:215 (-) Transcript_11932:104-748(-)
MVMACSSWSGSAPAALAAAIAAATPTGTGTPLPSEVVTAAGAVGAPSQLGDSGSAADAPVGGAADVASVASRFRGSVSSVLACSATGVVAAGVAATSHLRLRRERRGSGFGGATVAASATAVEAAVVVGRDGQSSAKSMATARRVASGGSSQPSRNMLSLRASLSELSLSHVVGCGVGGDGGGAESPEGRGGKLQDSSTGGTSTPGDITPIMSS